MSQFLIFKRYNTSKEAAETIALLEKHQIPTEYEEEIIQLDEIHSDLRHLVKIASSDLPRADALLKSQLSATPFDKEFDYHLFSFSRKELEEIIINKDEWSDYDYLLAQKLLEKQGITYTPVQLEQMDNSRIEALSQPKELQFLWLLLGYSSPLFVLVMFDVPPMCIFIFLGIFIGVFVVIKKKTLPNGKRVYAFTDKTRLHGKLMIAIGVVLIVGAGILLVNLL